jgi:hypothetical protein
MKDGNLHRKNGLESKSVVGHKRSVRTSRKGREGRKGETFRASQALLAGLESRQ